MTEFNPEDLRVLLAAFIEEYNLTTRKVAKAIGCSDATVLRLLAATTLPSDRMMHEAALMFHAGFARYARMTKQERADAWQSTEAGVVGGSVAGGFLAIPDVIALFGPPGLSASGISGGLNKMSGGNGMAAGVQVAAGIPLLAGTLGYAVLKGVEYFAAKRQLDATGLNPKWEALHG